MDKSARQQELEELATEGLAKAAAAAWKLAKETGTPFWVCRDGELVDLNAKPEGYETEIQQMESMRVREEGED